MKRDVWGILTPILGLTTWFVLFWLPIQIEWSAPDTQPWTVAIYLMPLVFLIFGAVTRLSPLLLFAFPASLIPGYMLLPELDQNVYQTGDGWLSLGVSLLAYLAAAALWARSRPARRLPGDRRPVALGPDGKIAPGREAPPLKSGADLPHIDIEPPALRRNLWWPYRLHFWPRLVLLALLLLVPLYGLNFADGAAAHLEANFLDQAPQAQIMANLLFLFVWVVIAYLFFISPGLNLELEQRELDLELTRLDEKLSSRRPPTWLIFIAAALTATLMGILVVLQTL